MLRLVRGAAVALLLLGGAIALKEIAEGVLPPPLVPLWGRGLSGIRSLSFSPDGRFIAVSTHGIGVLLLDAASGEIVRTATHREDFVGVDQVVFNPDGKLLATLSHEIAAGRMRYSVRLLSVPEGKKVATFLLPGSAFMYSWTSVQASPLAFHPSGERVAVGYSDVRARRNMVRIHRVRDGRLIRTIREPEPENDSVLTQIAFSPDGRRLVLGTTEPSHPFLRDVYKVLDLATDEVELVISTSGPSLAQFSPEGHLVVVQSWRAKAEIWDIARGAPLASIQLSGSSLGSLAVSPLGGVLALGQTDGRITLWDWRSGDLIGEWSALEGGVEGDVYLSFSPCGRFLAQAARFGPRKRVILWDVQGGVELWSSETSQYDPRASPRVGFRRDGAVLATGLGLRGPGSIELWDVPTGTKLATLQGHEAPILALAFSPQGTLLVSSSGDGTVRAWDSVEGREVALLSEGVKVWEVVFSPDGRTLALAQAGGTVLLVDPFTGAAQGRVEVPELHIEAMAFDPSGGRLLAAGIRETKRQPEYELWAWDFVSLELLWSKKLRSRVLGSNGIFFAGEGVVGVAYFEGFELFALETGLEVPLDSRFKILGRVLGGRKDKVAASPGKPLWAVGDDFWMEFVVWDTERFAPVAASRHYGFSRRSMIAFSPCGKYLVTSVEDVILWELPQLRLRPVN